MAWGKTRKAAFALMFVLAGFAAPPTVEAKSDPESTVAPPPTRTETIPKHKAGYVWAPGYWSWSERGHNPIVHNARHRHWHRGLLSRGEQQAVVLESERQSEARRLKLV